MSNLFEIVDPRKRKVVCTEERWNDHILSYHPFMQGHEEEVKEAIQNPTFGIYQDAALQSRNIYYALHKSKRYYIKVVVEFIGENDGNVITAFNTDSTKSGEKLIWPESST